MPLALKPPREGKTPYYAIRGTHLGVHVDRSTKTASRTQALKVLAAVKDEIERGLFAKPGEPTFLSAAVDYMAATGNERFVAPLVDHFGQKLLRLVDQRAIDEAAIKLYPVASAATRNRQVYTVASAILKHAGVRMPLRRPKGWRGTKRTDWLQPEQAFRIFAAAEKKRPEFAIFLRVLCYTGVRLSEGLSLACERVILPEAFAYVAKTKNEDPRGVHLPPVVVAALANHPRGLDRRGKVFALTKTGRLYTWLEETKKAASLDEDGAELSFVTFHTFRHTWATWMRRYGGLDTRGLVGTGAWRDQVSAARYEHVVVTEEARRADELPVEKAWKTGRNKPKALKRKAS